MSTAHLLWQLALIIIVARLLGESFSRLGYPAVLGELLAGLLLGPSLLNVIAHSETLHLIGQIGIVLLLFRVGQSSDIQHLRRHGGAGLLVAATGAVLPLAGGYALCVYGLGLSPATALLVGGTLTATSIAVALRALRELQQIDTPLSNTVLTAAILDDIIAVILLGLLYHYADTGTLDPLQALTVTSTVLVFFVLAPVAARIIALLIRHAADAAHIPGLTSTASLALVLVFAAIAESIGAPALLGGFAAGLALSHHFMQPIDAETPDDDRFVEKVRQSMHPIEQFFTPVFFVLAGASVSLQQLDWGSPALLLGVLALLAIAAAGKLASGLLLWRWPWSQRLAVGTAMMARGEVFLVFAATGHASGLLDNTLYSSLVLVMAIITLASPLCLKWALHWAPAPAPRPPSC